RRACRHAGVARDAARAHRTGGVRMIGARFIPPCAERTHRPRRETQYDRRRLRATPRRARRLSTRSPFMNTRTAATAQQPAEAPVRYECEGAVATITLNRPEVLNALDDVITRALLEAVERTASDETVRAVVLTGAGRGFSSGADLASVKPEALPDLGRLLRDRYHPLILTMRRMPKPIACAVR